VGQSCAPGVGGASRICPLLGAYFENEFACPLLFSYPGHVKSGSSNHEWWQMSAKVGAPERGFRSADVCRAARRKNVILAPSSAVLAAAVGAPRAALRSTCLTRRQQRVLRARRRAESSIATLSRRTRVTPVISWLAASPPARNAALPSLQRRRRDRRDGA